MAGLVGLEYGKAIADHIEKIQYALLTVYRLSVQALANQMRITRNEGGKLPILTGNLRRSLLASTAGPPAMGKPGDKYAGVDVTALFLGLQLLDIVYLGYQANYAHRLNYGFVGTDSLGRTYNQTGAGFLEDAKDKWKTIVPEQVAIVKQQAGI